MQQGVGGWKAHPQSTSAYINFTQRRARSQNNAFLPPPLSVCDFAITSHRIISLRRRAKDNEKKSARISTAQTF